MNIKEKNYWLETVGTPATGCVDPLPETADVAVIGAGFCGLSAARVARQAWGKYGCFRSGEIGMGSELSKRGHGAHGNEAARADLINRYGQEAVRRMYAASLESIELVEQIVREEGIAVPVFRVAGT